MSAATYPNSTPPVEPWKRAALLLAVSTVLLAAGCNTTAGVGKDLQSAGEAIEDAAEDAKD